MLPVIVRRTITSTAILLFLVFATVVSGQEVRGRNFIGNRAAQYTVGSADEVLIKVNIWGFVKLPGQYWVPKDTDLISLLSYAGGPLEEAKLKKIKLIRNSQDTQKVIEINVKKYLSTGNEKLIPKIHHNDTVIVSGSTFHFINKFFDFATRIALLVQVYYWARYWSKR